MHYVSYEAFGAVGDGKTNDIDAIVAAHAYANEHHLPVRTKADAHYYIGGDAKTAIIKTSTDWGTSRFTIDDRAVENNKCSVFRVVSDLEPIEVRIPTLTRGQKKIEDAPGVDCYVVVREDDIRRFIRLGLNQNNGSPQTDNFELKADGTIVHELLWDFPHVDRVWAAPIDTETLRLRGGCFTTVANQAPSTYDYYSRNIVINRSNVELYDMHHFVTGEGETGAPYDGFLVIGSCARVTVRDCFFTARKIYSTIGAAGRPVMMGSYDITIGSATDVLFKNCYQRDILDRSLWGLVGSNFCKNITLDGCVFSRMDAHQGVWNYTMKNCTLGHQGINAIGSGLLTIENCVLYGSSIVDFRGDYGSTWDGDLVIRNVVWTPRCGDAVGGAAMIGANNNEMHDFGYDCSLPTNVTIENVRVVDGKVAESDTAFSNVYLVNDYNHLYSGLDTEKKDENAPRYPYKPIENLTVRNLTLESGRSYKVCPNPTLKVAERVTVE